MKLKIDDLGVVGIIIDDWSFEKSFKPKTIVTDYLTWKTYISRRAVPKHIELENSYYWKPILKPYGDVKSVQSDWNQTDETQPDFIKNKPTIFESDRPYNPIDFSGMGKVYLPKNIVNDKNILTQDMFYKGEEGSRIPNTNTIFVVMWDFDLDGENITIPENSALEFDGGSISNGVVFSNKTVLMGKPNMEKYFGAFKDVEGRWLDHDLKPFEIVVKNDGYSGARDFVSYPTTLPYTGTQSIAICEYNDKEYVLIARINVDDTDESGNAAILISVTDINYNPVGYTYLDYHGHANGITVDKDGYLLVSEGTRAYNYYKVPVADVISNAANNNAPTLSGEVIDSEFIIHDLCYDERTDFTLITDVNFYKLRFYDSNGTKFKDSEKTLMDYFMEHSDFRSFAASDNQGFQQICTVNGIVYNLGITMGQRGDYLEVIDAQSGELIFWHIFRSRVEIEGICFYKGVFYVVFQNSLICKMGTHGDDFIAVEDYLRQLDNSMTVYVDNAYPYPPTQEDIEAGYTPSGLREGSYRRPFRSLTEALAITNGLPSVSVYIARRANPYAIDEGLARIIEGFTDGVFMCYQDRLCLNTYNAPNATIEDTNVTINGSLFFRGFVFRADGIIFDGYPGASVGTHYKGALINCNEPVRIGTQLYFYNCFIKNYLFCTQLPDSCITSFINCTFENISAIINGNYCEGFIKDSYIKNVVNVYYGYVTFTMRNTRCTNTNIGYTPVTGTNQAPLPRILCYENKEVDNLIHDYLDNGLDFTADAVYIDIILTTGTPSVPNQEKDEITYGVCYAKGTFRCFDRSHIPHSINGYTNLLFPIREWWLFNGGIGNPNSTPSFRKLFRGFFSKSFDSTNGIRMLEVMDGSTLTDIQAIKVTPDGRTYYIKRGSTRPTMYFTEDVGNEFFDTTINKMIYWTGDTTLGANGWVDANGGNPDA